MTSPLLCVPCVGLLVLTTWLTQPTMPQQPAAATNPATTPVARTDQGILARQSEVLTRAKEAAPSTVVFLGDSITQGFEGAGKTAWDTHIAPWGALNLGVSGDRTEHVLWRLQQAPLTRLQPRSVVLLIGTNNLGHGTSTAEQTLEGLWAVIRTIRTQVPDARLFVHEIFRVESAFSPCAARSRRSTRCCVRIRAATTPASTPAISGCARMARSRRRSCLTTCT